MEQTTRGTVTANSFAETNSRVNVIREQIDVSLPPGEYKVLIRLSDEESEKRLIRRRELSLRSFDRSGLKMSDIVFADQLDCSRIQSEDYIPNIRRVFFRSSSSFSAFWDVYTPADIDSVRLNLSLLDENNQPVFERQESHVVTGPSFRECLRFKEHIDHPGTYSLRVQAIAGEWSVKSRSQFHVYWGNLQLQEKNLDVALEQMKLVADSDRIDEISDANQDLKQQWFDEFWQRRDPDPETPENELKEEFFRRVDFANRHFSEYGFGARRTGWKTDRGRIYIRNGPPTEVERRATDFNMPTAEIWYYAKLDRRYIFTDRDGSGHFRLVKVE
jgi:GWxTD domain-containing protein